MSRKKHASSSGDTSAVHPYTTREFWVNRFRIAKLQNKSDHTLSRIQGVIDEFKSVADFTRHS